MKIRNFCIIAHIDHGKSTLADRMLEITETIRSSEKKQVLDRMDLEQERGITIKLTPVRMQRKDYEFNLIDTPGHVDFQYEVSRSLAAVEGVVLLVDASQGIQAQTLSTLYMAIDQNIEIIAVLNKIDLPAANPERVAQEIENVIGIDKSEIISISAKTGENVDKVLDIIIEKIEDPKTFKEKNKQKFRLDTKDENNSTTNLSRALIFDSVYDPYKGVLSYIKVVDGEFKSHQEVSLIHTEKNIKPTEVGHFDPEYHADKIISEGQIGYLVTGEKSVRDAQIGDTILQSRSIGNKTTFAELKKYTIPGFNESKPFVYAGVYPIETSEYDKLKESLEKLSLNDSAIEYELEDSNALGFGFRCGFLGMLHMDIIKERLSREYNIETIFTAPTVVYLVKSKNLALDKIKSGRNIKELYDSGLIKNIPNISQEIIDSDKHSEPNEELKPRIVIKSGADMVEQGTIDEILEPIAEVEVVGPEEYAGNIMELCQSYRGQLKSMEHLDETRVVWKYDLPLGEIIIDFYDKLKSSTKGFATMNYDFKGYKQADLIKLNVLINDEQVEALTRIVHKDKAYYFGKELCEKLKKLIPKHLFTIPIQASIGTKIIARETIRAVRKDVIAKCYGGDVSRKKKLLKKQKEGKKKMKAMGNVNVPSDLFINMVKRD